VVCSEDIHFTPKALFCLPDFGEGIEKSKHYDVQFEGNPNVAHCNITEGLRLPFAV
jgi:hypothetical protein